MLRKIPKIISPELMRYMMEMGHSDRLILADANFPSAAHGERVVRMDGVEIPELLRAILEFFPLDDFVQEPVRLMRNLPEEPVPKVWDTYRRILEEADRGQAFREFGFLDRLPFYEEAEKAYVIVQTGDEARYGNIILQKGVC